MNKSAGLYIHIPFCRGKCPYCDFYSIDFRENLADKFIGSFVKEMAFYKDTFGCFDTIYIGGGSPGALNEKQFLFLVENLHKSFKVSKHTEFTIELNPQDVTKEKLSFLKSVGVNRISLGAQSFNNRELKFLGRKHDSQTTKKAIGFIKSADFAQLNIDVMFGFSCQTKSSWLKTLNQAVSFFPEHISAYQLTIKENTPFGRLQKEGKLKEAGEKKQAELFLITSDSLEKNGYIHYEVSNFARDKKCMCRHNMKYWEHIPYLGIGPSAHSFLNGKRWSNFSDVERYCRACELALLPVDAKETLTEEQINIEKIYLGFRTQKGVSVDCLPSKNPDKIINELKHQNLVRTSKNRIIPTKKGFLVSGGLPLYFL